MKPKPSFEKFLLAGTVLIALMMSATGVMVYQNGRRTTDGVKAIRHGYEVIGGIEAVVSLVRDAEAAERGYQLTGRDVFLDSWQRADDELPGRLSRLAQLVADDTDQSAGVARLKTTATRRLALLDQGVSQRRGRREAAVRPTDTDAGRRLMSDLRGQAQALTDAEQNRLDARVNLAESTFHVTAATLLVVIVATVGVLLVLTAMAWRVGRVSRRSESELLELATRDELTGLANRREFNRRINEEVVRYERFPTPFSLVLLDIDHFKHVNDTYGHPGGDMVLRQIAAEILATVRKIDVAARYGGEELALILPGLTREQAFVVTDRIRLKIAARPFESDVGGAAAARFSVTLSAGVVVCDGRPRTVDSLIESADKALYAAKHGGRNRTVVAEAM